MKNKLLIILFFCLITTFGARAEEIIIVADTTISQVHFAVSELKRTLQQETGPIKWDNIHSFLY